MAKSKNGTAKAAAGYDAALKNGAETVRDGMEKAAASIEKFASFNRETVEALVKSANATTKGFEQINTEAVAFAKSSLEDFATAAKSVFTAKSVQEAFELQSDFTKSAFDAYVGQMTKFGDLFVSTVREANEPVQARVSAFMEMMQTPRAI